MRHELWYSERERSGVLLRERDTSSAGLKWPDARVIWAVDTMEYAVAADLCALVLRWDKREPVGPAATVRLTIAFYLDRQGNQCNATVPGWVGQLFALVPGTDGLLVGLLDYLSLVVPDRGRILGYSFIERPGCVAFDGPALVIQAKKPESLTVVSLRSADGTEELAQEFYGRIYEDREISRMVGERLGSEMAGWTITQVQVF
jgi:hypothetical protein